MKVFVSGATGFIGRRLVEKLNRKGIRVIALVRNDGHGLPDGTQTVCGDMLVPESLGKSGLGCDRLYHLGGMITFDPRKRDILIRVNGDGTKNVLEAAKRWNVERLVVVSSACTVGLSYSRDRLLDEDDPVVEKFVRDNPYMESKVIAEREALRAAKEQIVTIVNPTTVYGPGDYTLNSGTLVLKVARSGVMAVPPGGSNVVDVDDIVEGILMAGERGRTGRRYILGAENLEFGKIFSIIADVVGHRPRLVTLQGWMRRPTEVAVKIIGQLYRSRFLTPQIVRDMFAFKYYSNRRAKQEIGWTPRYSFQQSVERAWAFYRQEGMT